MSPHSYAGAGGFLRDPVPGWLPSKPTRLELAASRVRKMNRLVVAGAGTGLAAWLLSRAWEIARGR